MSETPYVTPIELLHTLNSLDNLRHAALVHELGEDTLVMAKEQAELEEEVTEGLSEAEEVAYYQMGIPGDAELSPREQVEDAAERFTTSVFNKVPEVSGYRIQAATLDHLVITNAARSPFGRQRGDNTTFDVSVDSNLKLDVKKLEIKDGEPHTETANATDGDIILTTASGLIKEVKRRKAKASKRAG